jgi:hypothetical protein
MCCCGDEGERKSQAGIGAPFVCVVAPLFVSRKPQQSQRIDVTRRHLAQFCCFRNNLGRLNVWQGGPEVSLDL